jgi:hypothetical protein
MHRVLAWSVGWLFAAALYLLLIDITSLPELYVGAGATVLAATAFALARERDTVGGLTARLRWLARLYRPLLRVPQDVVVVSALALRQLVAPKRVNGAYAKKLDSATSGISTDCGLASQVTAFPGDHRKDLATLEATAGTSVRKLAKVWKLNPNWIYQGETVRQIVGASLSYLDSCGLHQARAELARLTNG